MKAKHGFCLVLLTAGLLWPDPLSAAVTKTVTFDEFSPGMAVSNQVPGIAVAGIGAWLVPSPPPLANAEGPSVSALAGTTIRFPAPVTEVSLKLSFDFLYVTNIDQFFRIVLVGEDHYGQSVHGGIAFVQVSTTGTGNWAASVAQIKSHIPMTSVSFGSAGVTPSPWSNHGQRLCYDDLTFTVAPFWKKVNFESYGKKKRAKVPLTKQVPGLEFSGVVVQNPAPILNTFGVVLSGAKSGQAAACSAGARINFQQSATAFHTWVSPKMVQVCETGTNEVVAIGYDRDSNVLAVASVPLRYMVATERALYYNGLKPLLLSLESETPMAFVTMEATGSTGSPLKFYFDDIVYVPAPTVIAFEGLRKGEGVELTDQIPGMRFNEDPEVYTYVRDAYIRNSLGVPLTAATSGTDAATSSGTLIRFNCPLLEVSARVSPGFLSYNGHTTAHPLFYLVGYDAKGKEVARSATPILAAAATREEFDAFVPALVQLQSCVPMAYITLDWEETFDHNGGRLLFDDLTFTRAAVK